MAIRGSGYFNDAGIAQAAANLSSLFAPPSGADAAGWAAANARNAEARRMAELFDYAGDPNFDQAVFDRRGQAAGQWTPSTGYYGVNTGAETSRINNAADNARALQQTQIEQQGALARLFATPLKVGNNETAYIPGPAQGPMGLPDVVRGNVTLNPGEQSTLPGGELIAGAPKPLTESEWRAQQNERLRQEGSLSDQALIDRIMGEQTPVQAVGADGSPMFMAPGTAIRQGARPYSAPSASNLEGDNYLGLTPAGQETRFVGRPNASGQIVDISTGRPFAGQIIRREGTGGGMSLEVGKDGTVRMVTGNGAGQTTSRVTDLQRQEAEAGRGVQELTALFNTLRPDDLGLAGNLNEVLTNYGAQIFPGVARPDVSATRAQLEATTLGLARTLVGDDRLSDGDRRAANDVMVSGGLGESLPGAQAKLAALITLNAYRQRYANAVRTGGQLPELDGAMLGRLVDEGAVSPRVAQVYRQTVLARRPQAQGSPIPGVKIPDTSAAAIPTVSTPEEAAALPPGTRFRTPDGREKVRP